MRSENNSMHPITSVQYTEDPQATSANGLAREPLAIIGIGCHFPGGATSPQAFWELLCSGIDATREVPPDRWDARKFYDPDIQQIRQNEYLSRWLFRAYRSI